MPKTSESLRNLRSLLADHLDDIRALFRDEVKITLIIRNTTHADRDVVLGDDDPASAMATIKALVDGAKSIYVPPNSD